MLHCQASFTELLALFISSLRILVFKLPYKFIVRYDNVKIHIFKWAAQQTTSTTNTTNKTPSINTSWEHMEINFCPILFDYDLWRSDLRDKNAVNYSTRCVVWQVKPIIKLGFLQPETRSLAHSRPQIVTNSPFPLTNSARMFFLWVSSGIFWPSLFFWRDNSFGAK